MKYWQIFSQDSKIYNFLNAETAFQNCNIDTDCTVDNTINSELYVNDVDMTEPTKFTTLEIDKLETVEIKEITNDESKILNLKDNFFPKVLAPLEYLFDSNDIARKPKMEPLISDMEECNIGTEQKPKLIKLSKALPPDEKVRNIILFKEFQDVFAWSYEDLKSYDTSRNPT